MPWSHCDVSFILDTEDCPACGFTKAEWTVEFERTRHLQIAPRTKLRIQILRDEGPDAEPSPVAGAKWTVKASGKTFEGETEASGESLVKSVPTGTITISVPPFSANAFVDPSLLQPFRLKSGREPTLVTLVLARGDLPYRLEPDPPPGELDFALEPDPPPGELDFVLEPEQEPGDLSYRVDPGPRSGGLEFRFD